MFLYNFFRIIIEISLKKGFTCEARLSIILVLDEAAET